MSDASPQSETVARSRDQITALARGLAVIRAFSGQDEQMTLADIAKIVSLPRATTRRCLLTLEALGYVDVKGRFFRLAPQVLTLAQAYLSSSLLPRVAGPFLERLSAELSESCSVSVLHDDQVIYVARSTRKRLASLHRDVGARLPAYCTSMGRVLMAALPDGELDRILKRVPRDRLTRFTLVTPRELKEAIADVRDRDYSLVDQELEMDLRALAVPVRNTSGRVIAALNVSTQASRTSKRQLLDGVLPVIRQAAAEMRPLLLG